MSYEPTLIIYYPDLEKNRLEIDTSLSIPPKRKSVAWEKRERAFRELYQALYQTPFTIKGQSLIIITPELTSHNAAVRKLLHDLNIDFATTY